MQPKIFVLSFVPNYCPHCGSQIHIKSQDAQFDFFGFASHSCLECGVKFIYAHADDLIALAEKVGSDLPDRL